MQLHLKKTAYNLEQFKSAQQHTEVLHVSHQDIINDNFDCDAFKSLWGLKLLLGEEERVLPDWIFELDQLEYLSLIFTNMNDDWGDQLSRLQSLRYLDLFASKITELPASFSLLPSLQHINLAFSSITKLEPLPQIQSINLEGCSALDNKQLLYQFIEMPNLIDFTLPKTMSLKYSYGKENPEAYYLDKFLKKLFKKKVDMRTKEGLSDAAIRLLPYLHLKKTTVLQAASNDLYYELLNAKVAAYRTLALEYLVNHRRNTPTQLQGKKIYLAGKLKIKSSELQDLIKNLGAQLVKKVAEAHYLLLGEKAGEKLWPHSTIIYEQDLWDLSDQNYLMEEEHQTSSAAVLDLLQSNEDENINLALQLMDRGGFPSELNEEVIGIMLFHHDNKIRKKGKNIFDRYQQLTIDAAASKLLKRQVYRIREDKKVTLYIRQLAQLLDLDTSKLAYAAYRYSNKEQAQGLCLMSAGVSLKIMSDFVQYKMLYLKPLKRLAEGLYLEKLPSDIEAYIPELNKILGLKIDNDCSIKDDTEYSRLQGLKRAEINLGYSRKIPESIFENTAYEDLQLTSYSAKKIPAKIGNLRNLKELRLWTGTVSKLPKEMSNITGLQTLSLNLKPNSAFPDFILRNEHLRRLNIHELVSNLPEEIVHLKALERLSISVPLVSAPLFLTELPKLTSVSITTPTACDHFLLRKLNQVVDPKKLRFSLKIANRVQYPTSHTREYENLVFK